jgi:hypothetical protein
VNVGDKVRIERDETRYPPKGTWPQFRGKTGTIVEINGDEYGVCFGKVAKAPKSHRRALNWNAADVAWFKAYEIYPLAAVVALSVDYSTLEGADTAEAAA